MRSQRASADHRSFRKRSLAQEFGEGSQVHTVRILTAPWVGGRLSSFSVVGITLLTEKGGVSLMPRPLCLHEQPFRYMAPFSVQGGLPISLAVSCRRHFVSCQMNSTLFFVHVYSYAKHVSTRVLGCVGIIWCRRQLFFCLALPSRFYFLCLDIFVRKKNLCEI